MGCRLHVALGEQFVDQVDLVAAGVLELAPDALESGAPSRIPPGERVILGSGGTHDQTVAPSRVTVRDVSGLPGQVDSASLLARHAHVTPAVTPATAVWTGRRTCHHESGRPMMHQVCPRS